MGQCGAFAPFNPPSWNRLALAVLPFFTVLLAQNLCSDGLHAVYESCIMKPPRYLRRAIGITSLS
jgi:hypothetical protein